MKEYNINGAINIGHIAITAIAFGLVVGHIIGHTDTSRDRGCPTYDQNPWFPVESRGDWYIRDFVPSRCWTDDLANRYQTALDEFAGDREYDAHISRTEDGERVVMRVVFK